MRRSILLAAILIPALTPPEYSVVPKQVQVAGGVVLFITPRYGDVGLDGNSVAIISRDGVLVFDSNGTPAAAVPRASEAGEGGEGERYGRRSIMPSLEGPMKSITGGDPALAESFAIYLVDWYLHRVYDELDGPLTDDIARIPRHKPAGD